MNALVALYTFLGIALALLGFRRRPKVAGELVFPRFIIPLLFFIFGILPAAYYYYIDPPNQTYSIFRIAHQETAMAYICLCMVMFWVGFRIRFRLHALERLIADISFRFNFPATQRAGIIIVTLTSVYMFSLYGAKLWSGYNDLDLTGALGYITKYVIPPVNVLAAIAYGFGWPEKGEPRRSVVALGAIYVLVLCSIPSVAGFSRGSGLYPILMVLGYVGRFRRIPWFSFILSTFFVIYCSQVGLHGRGIYGHGGGVLNFLTEFRSGAEFDFTSASERIMSGEALTPLSVVMAAGQAHSDLQPLSPMQWIIFQIPVPHVFGLFGTYTLDPTIFVGGAGEWGYTASMFGDTFAHFGWAGCIAFVYMGILYRTLEELVDFYDSRHSRSTLAFLMLPVAYYSFLLGTFNTFRAWNSSFVFGIGILLLILWFYGKLKNQSEDWSPLPLPTPDSPL